MIKLSFIKILGFGDWGLGIWGLGIGPNPQSPIPNDIIFIKDNLILYKINIKKL